MVADVIGDATGRPQKCPSIFICKSEMNFYRDNTMEHNTTEFDNIMEHNTTEHIRITTQQRSTTQQRTQHNSVAQHNGAQHNGALLHKNTTENSTAHLLETAQQCKIHCQYVCSGGIVNHGTEICSSLNSLSLYSQTENRWAMTGCKRVKCRRFVCDFSLIWRLAQFQVAVRTS